MPIVLKSGNLNLLEPSGPVQACNGIALPFTFYIFYKLISKIQNIVIMLVAVSKIVIHGSEYHTKCRIHVVTTKIYVNKFAIFNRLTPTG